MGRDLGSGAAGHRAGGKQRCGQRACYWHTCNWADPWAVGHCGCDECAEHCCRSLWSDAWPSANGAEPCLARYWPADHRAEARPWGDVCCDFGLQHCAADHRANARAERQPGCDEHSCGRGADDRADAWADRNVRGDQHSSADQPSAGSDPCADRQCHCDRTAVAWNACLCLRCHACSDR